MSQGKHISQIVKKIVAAAVVEFPDSTREGLLPVIRGRVTAANQRQPADQTLLKLVSRYRNQPSSEMDAPWSLASFTEHEMAPDCVPVLMQVWRFALAIDRPLTVREAYWAARLRYVFPNPIYLWMWASAAAVGERSAEVAGQPFDSALLDTVASRSSGWELRTLALTGAPVSQLESHIPPLSYVAPDGSGTLERLALNPKPPRTDDDELFDHELDELLEALPPIDSIGLSYQSQMVYLRWLSYLSQGPKWRSLSLDGARDLVLRLREWTLTQQERILVAQDGTSPWKPDMVASEAPHDLIRMVGYRSIPRDIGYFVFSSAKHPYLDPE